MSDILGKIEDITPYLHKIWNYPLFTISNRELFIGNFLIAVFAAFVGIKYYKLLVPKLERYISSHINHDKTTSHVVQKVVSYLIALIYISFVLDLANIPMSSFAFLGGAIALGLGLGAQTLIGNFLSGLIVVMEKTLKIGDVIEIDGVIGTVKTLGIRSTKIRTMCNSDVVIPNSNFTHNMFVKLSDKNDAMEKKARLTVYSDKTAEAQIRKDITELFFSLGSILQKPKPEIYLTEVSDGKYQYTIYFYLEITDQSNIEAVQDVINTAMIKKLNKCAFDLTYPSELKIKREK